MRRWFRVAAAVSVALVAFSIAGPSQAQEERNLVHAKGLCSAQSIWEMAMATDIGIEFEVHLETGVPDHTWSVTMRYQGHVINETTAVTEEDGGFEVRLQDPNVPREDQFAFGAKDRTTGESCHGWLAAEE
jgi:hypothetical protein